MAFIEAVILEVPDPAGIAIAGAAGPFTDPDGFSWESRQTES